MQSHFGSGEGAIALERDLDVSLLDGLVASIGCKLRVAIEKLLTCSAIGLTLNNKFVVLVGNVPFLNGNFPI